MEGSKPTELFSPARPKSPADQREGRIARDLGKTKGSIAAQEGTKPPGDHAVLHIDFIPDGAAAAPLVRIRGNDPVAYQALHQALQSLTTGDATQVAIDQLPAIAPGSCRLLAAAAAWDRGVLDAGDGQSFLWLLTTTSWDNVNGLLQPFCDDEVTGGHQWLEQAGDIHVLVTRSGQW